MTGVQRVVMWGMCSEGVTNKQRCGVLLWCVFLVRATKAGPWDLCALRLDQQRGILCCGQTVKQFLELEPCPGG